MAERALSALRRRNAAQSAAINGALSLAFFLLVFGLPARPLAMGRPDGFALDFLPQAGAVGLMSALVPVLATRRAVARLTGQAPAQVGPILRRALGFALASLLPGAALAGAALAGPWPPLALGPALAIKILFGAVLGALVTPLAIERTTR